MKYNLTIIISHYNPNLKKNPLNKTIDTIIEQNCNHNIEIIIADDGSLYSKNILENYSEKKNIPDDNRLIYISENEKLEAFLDKQNIKNNLITKWVYLPKTVPCMSKAKVLNYSTKYAESNNLFFLDDDNYLISRNTITHLLNLFESYDFIIGQIKDSNGRLRPYSSNRVQGTTVGIKKYILENIGGFGEWTEKYSCGIDSDFWIKIFNYYKKNTDLKACYTDKIKTFDSYSKRWKKYTKLFKEINLKKEFNSLYNCKNYKNAKYNLSRNKKLWIENLIDKGHH